jgi:hypothetical protein
VSNWTLPRTTASIFRDSREIEGLRGDRGKVVLVEGAGLATADGILMVKHKDNRPSANSSLVHVILRTTAIVILEPFGLSFQVCANSVQGCCWEILGIFPGGRK